MRGLAAAHMPVVAVYTRSTLGPDPIAVAAQREFERESFYGALIFIVSSSTTTSVVIAHSTVMETGMCTPAVFDAANDLMVQRLKAGQANTAITEGTEYIYARCALPLNQPAFAMAPLQTAMVQNPPAKAAPKAAVKKPKPRATPDDIVVDCDGAPTTAPSSTGSVKGVVT